MSTDQSHITLQPGFTSHHADGTSSQEYYLNMGPQHPSTHGVLRLVIRLDGETIQDVVPHMGYIHRSIEKMGESQTYLQYIHLTDRMDYLSSHMNNLGVCLAIEKAMDIGVPERGQWIRVMICELQRLQSHLLFWGVMGMELGSITSFLYGFKTRELITDIFEHTCGARLTMNYFRPGGSNADVHEQFIPQVTAVISQVQQTIDEMNQLLTRNVIFQQRTKGIAIVSKQTAISHGCTGAVLRASGVAFDVRKAHPYAAYDQFDFSVPTGTVGDSWDRYQVRVAEMEQSIKILQQAIASFPGGPYRSKPKPALRVPAGIHYSQVETARGLFGTWFVSSGKGEKPYRVKTRSPNFSNLSVIGEMARGLKLADLITIISTLDLVIPDIDR